MQTPGNVLQQSQTASVAQCYSTLQVSELAVGDSAAVYRLQQQLEQLQAAITSPHARQPHSPQPAVDTAAPHGTESLVHSPPAVRPTVERPVASTANHGGSPHGIRLGAAVLLVALSLAVAAYACAVCPDPSSMP